MPWPRLSSCVLACAYFMCPDTCTCFISQDVCAHVCTNILLKHKSHLFADFVFSSPIQQQEVENISRTFLTGSKSPTREHNLSDSNYYQLTPPYTCAVHATSVLPPAASVLCSFCLPFPGSAPGFMPKASAPAIARDHNHQYHTTVSPF